ncbi:MAG: hypothetical protein EPN36_06355 [Rhodanobacteraceae bacterium]|nr:MAG: hypothetical protein EPN36_06355 [Rhodanobacteraceae bacterium]
MQGISRDISRKRALTATGLLALLMLLTRTGHFGDALHMPDASMAVFFLGGVYVRRHGALAVLLILAVAIDYVAIRYAGVSDFCVTAAYAFLPLAYAALWYGASACTRLVRHARPLPAWLGLTVGVVVFASLSFLISNGSFYWLGGRVAHPDLAGWAANAWQWGPRFVATTLAYAGSVLLAQAVWVQLRDARRARDVAA